MAASPLQVWRVAEMAGLPREKLASLLSADPGRAAPWVEACAALGVIEAQVRWGRMLLAGEGVAKDALAAFRQFEAAAEAGSIDALNMMGRCLEMGWGVEADAARAACCFVKAAEAGDAWAQYNYGHLLLDGHGLERDPGAALEWYGRAADQGHPRAMNLLGRCLEEGWGAMKDLETAKAWYRRSAEAGYFRGCWNHASALAAEGCRAGAAFWFDRAVRTAPEPTRSTMLSRLRGRGSAPSA